MYALAGLFIQVVGKVVRFECLSPWTNPALSCCDNLFACTVVAHAANNFFSTFWTAFSDLCVPLPLSFRKVRCTVKPARIGGKVPACYAP